MKLDTQTLRDLEIFEAEDGEQTLFDYCNFTRTQGGASVLRQRMENPFSDAAQIRDTQSAAAFINANREIFRQMPGAYATSRVEHYQKEILPVVHGTSLIEFSAGALSTWINHERHYSSIARGVHSTCGYLGRLRRFAFQESLDAAEGSLAAMVNEIREQLRRPGLDAVPDRVSATRLFRIMRLDQRMRLAEQQTVKRLLQLTYELDALVSMADAIREHQLTMPDVISGPVGLFADELIHPFLSDGVPNPVELDQNSRVLFLTGPNMAGKTTYIRAVAIAIYLAHLGMGVPASAMRFVPVERLFTSISLHDDLRRGVSYFRAEALRAKAIAASVADGHKVIALMDEPFKGTNVKDAMDASLAILTRLAEKQDCLFVFSSHLIELCDQLQQSGSVTGCYFEADESRDTLQFDFRLRPGVSSQRLGLRVLKEEGVFDLLDPDNKEP